MVLYGIVLLAIVGAAVSKVFFSLKKIKNNCLTEILFQCWTVVLYQCFLFKKQIGYEIYNPHFLRFFLPFGSLPKKCA
jgi:hypothetical protein